MLTCTICYWRVGNELARERLAVLVNVRSPHQNELKQGNSIQLVLFFTRGSSLKRWEEAGLLSRELAIYKGLQSEGVAITLVTYGNRDDLNFAVQIPGIKIICNRWSLPENWYIRLLPYLIRMTVGKKWIGKSNQTLGADIGLTVTRRAGQKFIARAGYLFSLNAERSHGSDSKEARYARVLEKEVFEHADRIVVTTKAIANEVKRRYFILDPKIVVIPNYVDTDLFFPGSREKGDGNRICYVGRMVAAKNFLTLLEAISDLSASLFVVGTGPLLEVAKQKAHKQKNNVTFWGNVPNNKLPQILNQCNLFVLPSLYEGHPKSLLEAMACGLPVIATNVPGNNDLIRHEIDGYLCGSSPGEIREAIRRLMGDKALCQRLEKNARARVVKEFSLNRIVELEMNLLKEMSTF